MPVADCRSKKREIDSRKTEGRGKGGGGIHVIRNYKLNVDSKYNYYAIGSDQFRENNCP